MCYVTERPIHRTRKPVYEMSLTLYPTALCGDDLQKGEPVRVSEKGEDVYELKCRTKDLILSAVPCEGKCFVEMLITEEGKYFDRDEWWCEVTLVEKKVVTGGRYEC